jgi:hypothetical protein
VLHIKLKTHFILLLDNSASYEENAVPALPYVTDMEVVSLMLFVLCACKLLAVVVVEGT